MWGVCLTLRGACLDSCTAQPALCVLEGSSMPWGPLKPQLLSLRPRALISMLHCTGGQSQLEEGSGDLIRLSWDGGWKF